MLRRTHLMLVLNPNVVWLTITQGLSYHVEKNPEALKKLRINFFDYVWNGVEIDERNNILYNNPYLYIFWLPYKVVNKFGSIPSSSASYILILLLSWT
jgi:hypothetical protein